MNIDYILQCAYEQIKYNIFQVLIILNEKLPIPKLIKITLFFMQNDKKKQKQKKKNYCVFRNVPLLKLRL